MLKHLNRFALFGLGIFLFIGLYGSNKKEGNSPGDLSLSHSHLAKQNCTTCHSAPGEISPEKCLSCHDKIATRITEKRGYHHDKSEDCGTCHTEHQGRDSRLIKIDEDDFDHSETGYKLRGMHEKIKNCRSCHSPSRIAKRKNFVSYLLTNNECTGCHTPPHPGIKGDCLTCHDESSWIIDNWRN